MNGLYYEHYFTGKNGDFYQTIFGIIVSWLIIILWNIEVVIMKREKGVK